ncbi:MAG: hypothetical protein ACJAZD_002799 [Ilumatobacter sp.]
MCVGAEVTVVAQATDLRPGIVEDPDGNLVEFVETS